MHALDVLTDSARLLGAEGDVGCLEETDQETYTRYIASAVRSEAREAAIQK